MIHVCQFQFEIRATLTRYESSIIGFLDGFSSFPQLDWNH